MDLKSLLSECAVTLVGGLAVNEISAKGAEIASRVCRFAVSIAPLPKQDRLAEEWESYLEDTHGSVSKIWQASGFVFAALELSWFSPLRKLCLLLVLAAINPVPTVHVVKFFRNYGRVARSARAKAGWEIPWSPFELSSIKEFGARYSGNVGAIDSDINPLLAWLKSDPEHALVVLLIASGLDLPKMKDMRVRGKAIYKRLITPN